MTQRHHRRRKGGRVTAPRPKVVGVDCLAEDGVMTAVGWCQDDSRLDEVKKATHDKVVKILGGRRKGSVQWIIVDDPVVMDDALGKIDSGEGDHYAPDGTKIGTGWSEQRSNEQRQLRGLIREYGGILVIALASGAEPPGIASFGKR